MTRIYDRPFAYGKLRTAAQIVRLLYPGPSVYRDDGAAGVLHLLSRIPITPTSVARVGSTSSSCVLEFPYFVSVGQQLTWPISFRRTLSHATRNHNCVAFDGSMDTRERVVLL